MVFIRNMYFYYINFYNKIQLERKKLSKEELLMKKKLIDEIEIKKLVIKELIKELSILKCQMHLNSDEEKEEGLSKEEWNRFMYLEGKRTFNTKINEERSFGEKVRDIRLLAFFTKKRSNAVA